MASKSPGGAAYSIIAISRAVILRDYIALYEGSYLLAWPIPMACAMGYQYAALPALSEALPAQHRLLGYG